MPELFVHPRSGASREGFAIEPVLRLPSSTCTSTRLPGRYALAERIEAVPLRALPDARD
jgi:hypothetical protein